MTKFAMSVAAGILWVCSLANVCGDRYRSDDNLTKISIYVRVVIYENKKVAVIFVNPPMQSYNVRVLL